MAGRAKPIQHGTISGYCHYRCRCNPCATAKRRYDKARQAGRLVPQILDATGTTRRLQALAALGWPTSHLAERLGYTTANAVRMLRDRQGHTSIRKTTADRVKAVYDELSMTLGPSDRARRDAARKAWAPPLAWDNIDDPDEQPKGRALTDGKPVCDTPGCTKPSRALGLCDNCYRRHKRQRAA